MQGYMWHFFRASREIISPLEYPTKYNSVNVAVGVQVQRVVAWQLFEPYFEVFCTFPR